MNPIIRFWLLAKYYPKHTVAMIQSSKNCQIQLLSVKKDVCKLQRQDVGVRVPQGNLPSSTSVL